MTRLFGTDGVRGVANRDLTGELAFQLSVAAAGVLAEAGAFEGTARPRALVGRDTRISGEFLSAAVVSGLASAGVDVLDLGVIPTPGLAFLVSDEDVQLGVMLSASHNPMPDNGIKFFQRGGVKLDDALEDRIEACLGRPGRRPEGAAVGRIFQRPDLVQRYIDHLVGSLEGIRLSGLRIVIDCANGAATVTAEEAFTAVGARVIGIHNRPNGVNINENCGSTHLASLQAEVIAQRADLGIALDGDADRCLAVDAAGQVVDGDQLMGILALAMQEQGTLAGDTLVATVMSNLGLIQAMQAHGITVAQTAVGDRYVREAMVAKGHTLGGEQSGHVIMSRYATTGDGVLTGLQVARRIIQSGRSLTRLAEVMTRLPQVLVNVDNVDKARAGRDAELLAAVQAANEELAGSGRVVLRPSGTEPLVRVMVEAPSEQQAERIAQQLAAVVRGRLSLA